MHSTSSLVTTPLDHEVEAAIERAAIAKADAERARLRAEYLIARSTNRSTAVEAGAKERDLTGRELDRAMGWSSAHRRRLGLKPAYHAGDEERSPRYHLDDVRRQLAERGPKATKAAPKRVPDVDVSDDLARAGLKLVGGAR